MSRIPTRIAKYAKAHGTDIPVGTGAATRNNEVSGTVVRCCGAKTGRAAATIIGPILTAQDPTGKRQNGFLVASPYDNARHVLFITCEPVPRISPEQDLLLFYGGFAPPAIMNDTAQEAGFLAFMYPAAKAEELKKTIGAIDR
jgi:hypothetical protein